MNKIVKLVISIPIAVFCFFALKNIFQGEKNIIDELVMLAIGIFWFTWLKKKFKVQKFIKTFFLFICFVVLHNFLSFFLNFEEPVFFFLALFTLAYTLILMLIFVYKQGKRYFSLIKEGNKSR